MNSKSIRLLLPALLASLLITTDVPAENQAGDPFLGDWARRLGCRWQRRAGGSSGSGHPAWRPALRDQLLARIEFHAPHYDEQGNRVRPGRISVNHNGKMTHTDAELPDSPRAEKRRKSDPASVTVGRILLHYHHDPVEYRNIWVRPFESSD